MLAHEEVLNADIGLIQECLDYTLFNPDYFKVHQLLGPPAMERVLAEVALPSSTFPSDHIPVAIDLMYKR